MPFVAAALVGIAAVFTGVFTVSTVRDSLNDIAFHRTERGARFDTALFPEAHEEPMRNLVYPGQTTATILNKIPNTSHFRSLYEKASGIQFFEPDTLYTFFIPTDNAFEKLHQSLQAELASLSDADINRLVAYHIIHGKMVAVGGQKSGWVQTRSGDMLNLELQKNGGAVANAHLTAAYRVDNGIVYVVDHVLLPPEKRPLR